MSVSFTRITVTASPEQPSIVNRQVTLTQTITYPDATSTAVVTLNRGSPPTESPAPPGWSTGAASSDGLSQQQIGIIVGCLVGAAVLGIVLWCCCTKRCGCTSYSAEEDTETYYSDEVIEVTHPRRSYWPGFPQSIPPPAVPTYIATDTGPQWTAYEASRRVRPDYYGG